MVSADFDLIVYAGDIFDSREPEAHTHDMLAALADVGGFAILGNHDFLGNAAARAGFAASNVDLLRGVCQRWNDVLICGVDDPLVDAISRRRLAEIEGIEFADVTRIAYAEQIRAVSAEAAAFDGFTILLAHRPDRIADYASFDLAITGHAHGGQWRLPRLLPQGLYAPHQGLFPRYTSGMHYFNDGDGGGSGGAMVVSRGLAGYSGKTEIYNVPRIFNRPELLVVTIAPAI